MGCININFRQRACLSSVDIIRNIILSSKTNYSSFSLFKVPYVWPDLIGVTQLQQGLYVHWECLVSFSVKDFFITGLQVLVKVYVIVSGKISLHVLYKTSYVPILHIVTKGVWVRKNNGFSVTSLVRVIIFKTDRALSCVLKQSPLRGQYLLLFNKLFYLLIITSTTSIYSYIYSYLLLFTCIPLFTSINEL